MFFLKFFCCRKQKKSYFCSRKSKDSTKLNGGTVAQLVEQRTENPRVTGSIPVGTTHRRDATFCVSFFCGYRNTTPYIAKKHLPKGSAFFVLQ